MSKIENYPPYYTGKDREALHEYLKTVEKHVSDAEDNDPSIGDMINNENNKPEDNSLLPEDATLLIDTMEQIYRKLISTVEKESGYTDDEVEYVLRLSDISALQQYFQLILDLLIGKNPTAKTPSDEQIRMLFLQRKTEERRGIGLIAFYCLCTRYRRIKQYRLFYNLTIDEDFKKIFDQTGFEGKSIYQIQGAYALIQPTIGLYEEAYHRWQRIDNKKLQKKPAFSQIYAETVALCAEKKILSVTKDRKTIEGAIELMENAIRIRPYAKFYATIGRLQAILKQYEAARKNYYQAIDKEIPDRRDYSIRIGEYQAQIIKISGDESYDSIDSHVAQIQAETNKSKYDILSFLGFFSAILALIINSSQAALSDMEFIQKYQMMIALAGVIIISFGTLNLLMDRPGMLKKTGIMIAAGGGLVILSLVLPILERL